MKRVIYILLIWIIPFAAYSQNDITINSEKIQENNSQWNTTNAIALLDDQAVQVGTYTIQLIQNRYYKYVVNYNGSTITIDALTSLAIIPGANRIITWGAGLEEHVAFTVSFKIYDLNGSLIKSADDVGSAPFWCTITSDGDLLTASRSVIDEQDSSLYLRKFNRNGREVWNRKTTFGIPQDMAVSPNGDFALLKLNWVTMSANILIYDRSGNYVQTIDREVVSSIEYLADRRIAISGAETWYVYDYNEQSVKGVLKGTLNGNTLSMHPFTMIGTDLVAIANLADPEELTGYFVDIYDLTSGKLVHRIKVSDNAIGKSRYRCLFYDPENGHLKVRAGKAEILYQLTIDK